MYRSKLNTEPESEPEPVPDVPSPNLNLDLNLPQGNALEYNSLGHRPRYIVETIAG